MGVIVNMVPTLDKLVGVFTTRGSSGRNGGRDSVTESEREEKDAEQVMQLHRVQRKECMDKEWSRER